ncbi:hypothetical protein CTP10_R69600 (plasmid) [Cupriavidus sp. P-10]|uniref:hypothetical protein n=1 Tax=Cupriavidus sp. P-10 TaxID=2027911 RepID=UPI0011C178D4|nr:hypothetical protein [Cupriavidus sp. P-10]BDB29545.1 hypothetical protein CTP10_R69600 [Cupriavidus sp. P-10]
MDVFTVAFGRLLGDEEVDLQAEFAIAKTNLTGKKDALLASLADSGIELDLTDDQWARVLAWVADTQAWEAAFIAFATAHASDAVTESQLVLQILTTNLTESFNRLIKRQAEMIAEAEKNQEKKLRRLTSDFEKMRTLTDGVRKRAERAERDNRKLINELRQLKSTRAPVPVNQAPDTSDLSKALDAFF